MSYYYWSIFGRNLVGLAKFAGSKFQQMANWPSFDTLIETGWIARNRPPLSYNSPCFDCLTKLRQLAIIIILAVRQCAAWSSTLIPLLITPKDDDGNKRNLTPFCTYFRLELYYYICCAFSFLFITTLVSHISVLNLKPHPSSIPTPSVWVCHPPSVGIRACTIGQSN